MADDPKFYSVGGKVILETWVSRCTWLLSLDTGWDTLSQRTRKILLQQGTLSVKALGRLSLDTE